jgi:hypothetical protein
VRARDAVLPGLLALLATLVVTALTLLHDHGDLSAFVTAGTQYVAPQPHLHLHPGTGYDGQFVYRLARAPLDLRRTAYGITFDNGIRVQRIGLPTLAYLVSGGGRPTLLPAALIAIEVVAVGVTGALGGLVAQQAGRASAWGLLLALVPGLAFGVQHDLTEPLEITLLVAGVLLLRAGRPVWAGVALAAAALTRETALLFVAAVILERLVTRRRVGRQDAAWLLPVVAFAAWQLTAAAITGSLPLHSDTGANLALPFVGLVHLLSQLPSDRARPARLVVVQLVWLAYLLMAVVPQLARAPRPLVTAWGLTALFSLTLSTFVWEGYDDLRFLLDLTAVSMLVLLASRRRLTDVAVLTGAVWVITLVLRVT